jgi:hypothetical protein
LAIRVSKTALAIVSVIAFLTLAGAGGFIAWRISQEREVTPEESEAGEICPDGQRCECPDHYGVPSDGCICWCTTQPDCPLGQSTPGTCVDVTEPPPSGDLVCETDPGGDWCGQPPCNCSNWSGDEPQCWTHGESGCWYDDGICRCGGQPTDPDCVVAGSGGGSSCTITVTNCGTARVSVAQCRESFSTLAEYNAATNNGTDCTVGCSSHAEDLSDGTHTISVGEPDCGRWQLDVNYNGRSLCWGSGCNWIAEVCELEDEPDCGDGVLDPGEQCELGDPAGTTCSWATECDQNTCTCPVPISEYLQVSGEVFCEDDNGERFPVQGAEIYFYKNGDPGTSENLTTSSGGSFVSAANTTESTDGPFAVRYSGLADPSRTLSNGTPYSEMTGPVLESPDVCTTGRCDTCGASYESCQGLTDPITYSGFDWVFANCSQELPNPDWDIEKEGSVVCYEEGTESVYAEASYVITVTNVAEGGTVEYVTDEFDDSITDSWITSTTPTATSIEDGVIMWTLSGSDGEFTEGESTEFRYTVRIPQTLFEQELNNHSIARLSTGEDLHAYEDIFVTCGLPQEGPLPETGLLDSAIGRIAIGSVLIVMAYAYYKFGLVDTAAEWITGTAGAVAGRISYTFGSEGKKDRWEKRMVKDVERRRKKR